MKLKRIYAFAAVVILTASCAFAGCSDNNGGKDEKSAQQSPASEIVQDSEPSAAEKKTESKQEKSSSEESSSPASSEDTITPRICEVTDDAGNKIYTMGTIHLADESVMHMPGYFETAFAQSDAVAVECDIQLGGIDIMNLTKLMYMDKTTIKDHVSAEDYEKVKSIVSSSPYYNQMYDYIKPMMWASLAEATAASEAGLSESYGVDNMLISRAQKEDKEVIEIEGTEMQMTLIGEMPEPSGIGSIVVACAGTSDLPVAEEAAMTAEVYGNHVIRLYGISFAYCPAVCKLCIRIIYITVLL